MKNNVTTKLLKIKALPAAIITATACLAVTICLCWLSIQVSKENAQRRLQESIFQHHSAVQNELEHEVSRLESFVSLYRLSPHFDRYAFHSFANIENQPWISAKLFAPEILAADIPSFESKVRRDTSVDPRGYPEFEVNDNIAHQDALVALYMEPRQALNAIHGRNLEKWLPGGSARIRDSGQALSFVLSGNHQIFSGNQIILAIPVYENGKATDTVAQRRATFKGIFATAISADKLLNHVFQSTNLRLNKTSLSGTGLDNQSIAISINGMSNTAKEKDLNSPHYNFELPISVPGKQWLLNYDLQLSTSLADSNTLWFIAIIGVLLTAFASGFVYVAVRTGEMAFGLAKDMTKALHLSEKSLLETQRLAKMGSFQLDSRYHISAQTGNLHALFHIPQRSPLAPFKSYSRMLHAVHEDDAVLLKRNIQHALRSPTHQQQVVQILSTPPTWLNLILNSNEQKGEIILRIIAMDVTDKYESEQKIKELAYSDALTGLANRTSLRIAIDQSIKKSKEHQSRIALFFLDLDRFKFINDSVGHDVGDQVLIQIAQRLRAAVKGRDFIARIGGDEFVILVEEIDAEKDMYTIADRILSLVCAPMVIENHTYHLTTSIGISIGKNGSPESDVLMKRADIAMYRSKEKGKNKYTVFSNDIADALDQSTRLERELRKAMKDDQFESHFQPQYDANTHKMCGVETLLRWNHPERGMVSAKDFIKTVEESGLVIEIGNKILVDVCQTIAKWNLPKDFVIGVNVSSLQFFESGFVDFVINTIKDAGIEPSRLEIEVTETMIMQDIEIAKASLEQLHAFGVGISIDDFGTGYASLTYLRDFPVQRIKIDQRFVQGHTLNSKDLSIVKAITTLGHDFGMQVIAEGVETSQQLTSLEGIGCDVYQGWLRSTAMTAKAIEDLLAV